MILGIIVGSIVIIAALCYVFSNKQDLSFTADKARNMTPMETLKEKRKKYDKLIKEQNEEENRQYKMLKKMIAKKAKKGETSLFYLESWLFNEVISYKVKDRLKQEGFRIDDYKNTYEVQNGFGAKWKEHSYGFTIYWG